MKALIVSYGRQDLESRFCSRGDPLRAEEQILRPLRASGVAALDSDAVLGPQDDTSREKGHLQQSSLILSEPAGAGSELAREGEPRASRKDERDVQHG